MGKLIRFGPDDCYLKEYEAVLKWFLLRSPIAPELDQDEGQEDKPALAPWKTMQFTFH